MGNSLCSVSGDVHFRRRSRLGVDVRDFGKGPFRWVVKRWPGGPILGASQPFDLPHEANQVVPVEVSPDK